MSAPIKIERRGLGSTGFKATVLGIGDLADRSVPVEQCVATIRRAMDFGLNLIDTAPGCNRPLEERPRGKFSSGGKELGTEPALPRLSVSECLHYTLTAGPDVALLGLSFPNEQDAAFEALGGFRLMTPEAMEKTRRRAAVAIEGKGPCWWNPAA